MKIHFQHTFIPLIATLCLALSSRPSAADNVRVDPSRAAIVLPADAGQFEKEAANELAYHLQLITGRKIPLESPAGSAGSGDRFTFHIGMAPAGENKPWAPEESRWVITPSGAWFYGDPNAQRSALYAVYGFLQTQLDVRWIEPGEFGVAHPTFSTLTLQTGRFDWIPRLEMRQYRSSFREGHYPTANRSTRELADFLPSHEQYDQWARDTRQWQMRMRMGRHTQIKYGHAFTDWWRKYSKTHPDYFALNKWGKREPETRTPPSGANPKFTRGEKTMVKLCVSNPAVADQIVQNWLEAGKKTGKLAPWINVCMNDKLSGFCRCDRCRALDVTLPGENWEDHLSDRYVYLANEVVKRARVHDPKVGVTMYAYEATLQPPRKQRLEPNIAVLIVPVSIDPARVDKLFKGWKEAGATVLMTRPNYPHYYQTIGMPMGFAQQMYDALQAALKNGAVGVDYDSMLGHWRYFGLTDYVLARTMAEPDRSFADLQAEYCSAFGPAAKDVAAYYDYWREQFWNQRVRPHLHQIVEQGKVHNFARGLLWSMGDYYRKEDFDRTDAILRQAAEKHLTPAQKQRLDELILANQQARLTFNAVTTKGTAKFKHSLTLLDFRREHKNDPHFYWYSFFTKEAYFGDMSGIETALHLKQYPLPWIQTDNLWQFKPDPENVGLKEQWPKLDWKVLSSWDRLRTNSYWGAPAQSTAPPKLKALLKNYTGIGWYATRIRIPEQFKGRQVALYFGAVDESCEVFVNGQKAGEHLYQQRGDDSSAFEIDVTPCLDLQRPMQTIVVRVENKGGAGGIWKRVWLVSK